MSNGRRRGNRGSRSVSTTTPASSTQATTTTTANSKPGAAAKINTGQKTSPAKKASVIPGLLKLDPMEHIARRKVENRGPSSVLQFPKNLGAHGTLMRFFEYKYGGPKGSEETRLAEVMLPLPRQIQDNMKINVGGEELGLLGNTTAQAAGDPGNAASLGENLRGGAGKIAETAGRALAGMDPEALVQALTNTADASGYVMRAGLSFISPDVANGLGRGRGTAVNPFASMVFKGVDLKVHSLEWLLSPESEEESRQLKTIIRTLQRMVLPKTSSVFGQDAEATGLEVIDRGILRYPAMVNIYLMGVDASYYLRFKTSMISNLSVDYTPNGLAIQKGGKPSAVRITMTLNEGFIHTAEDYNPSDLIEEAIAEKIDARIVDNLSDGESPEYDASIVNNPTGVAPSGSVTRTSDEVTIIKTLPDGSTQSRTTTKVELKSQGFTDAQIAGTTPTGVEGVTFEAD